MNEIGGGMEGDVVKAYDLASLSLQTFSFQGNYPCKIF